MKSIEFVDGRVRFIDQTRLPHEEIVVETDDSVVVVDAIRSLAIRGAPLIGIAGAYAVVLASRKLETVPKDSFLNGLSRSIALLRGSRPTAFNLFWALDRMENVAKNHLSESCTSISAALRDEAIAIHREDEQMCTRIGEHGASLFDKGARILTHCNTGALATGGSGTALSVIMTASSHGKIERVYVDETRPALQGARLTMWELMKASVPATLITDSTAASLMRQGKIDAVIVGADRIAANGGVANKIGTYNLAVIAEKHGLPFYVAAPSSTIDFSIDSEMKIPIEVRDTDEVVEIFGRRIAPEGAEAFAPAFDATPPEMISAIITELGVFRNPFATTLIELKRRLEKGSARTS